MCVCVSEHNGRLGGLEGCSGHGAEWLRLFWKSNEKRQAGEKQEVQCTVICTETVEEDMEKCGLTDP